MHRPHVIIMIDFYKILSNFSWKPGNHQLCLIFRSGQVSLGFLEVKMIRFLLKLQTHRHIWTLKMKNLGKEGCPFPKKMKNSIPVSSPCLYFMRSLKLSTQILTDHNNALKYTILREKRIQKQKSVNIPNMRQLYVPLAFNPDSVLSWGCLIPIR